MGPISENLRVRVCVVQSKTMISSTTNLKRSATTVDGGVVRDSQPQRPTNDHVVVVSTGDKPVSAKTQFHARPSHPQTSPAGRSTPDQRAAASPPTRGGRHGTAAAPAPAAVDGRGRGRLRPGGDRGSDSDSRRRDVRFAADTVVQTGDGRTLIVDDSAADRRHQSPSKRSGSVSGGTLPARLRGQAARRVVTDAEQRDVADARTARQSAAAQRGNVRPRSAVFDDEDQRLGTGPGGSFAPMTARTGSVPQSMNVVHRGSTASVARTREVTAQPMPVARRVIDHRDSVVNRYHHRR